MLIWHRINHSVKRRRLALHQTHHHYYLNVSVQAANLSDWRIESNRIEKIDSVARIESNRIETFWPELECFNLNPGPSTHESSTLTTRLPSHPLSPVLSLIYTAW